MATAQGKGLTVAQSWNEREPSLEHNSDSLHLSEKSHLLEVSRTDIEVEDLQVIEPEVSGPLASYVLRESGLTVEIHDPRLSPERWREYLDGATERYRDFGVLHALGREELEDGGTTTLFFVVVDDANKVVAGFRCHGPIENVSELYALRELKSHPRLADIRSFLEVRIREGLIENKGAWISQSFTGRGLSAALSRCYVHALDWFGVRFAVSTAAKQVVRRWQITGGQVHEEFGAINYPDARYETVLLYWDRSEIDELCLPDQWSQMVVEADAIMRSRAGDVVGDISIEWGWRAEVLNPSETDDRTRLKTLLEDPSILVFDSWSGQVDGLQEIGALKNEEIELEQSRWAYYPWRHRIVRIAGPRDFRTLRLDRNRNKITRDEQERLGQLKIGVVGLSVGHSIAFTLAQEGICGELRLADFDRIELSNLNRIPASILDLGVNKAVAVARRIAELDPYLEVNVTSEGATSSNLGEFMDGLDVVVEECDSLDLKLLIREAARHRRIPVIMETSDRGLLDVERFDLEPTRPLFHGLLGGIEPSDLAGLSSHDKVPYVLRILEPAELSSRTAASMAEINETLAAWPQLAGDVSLGASSVAAAIRRLGRGEALPSGRVRIDLESALDRLAEPPSHDLPDVPVLTDAVLPQEPSLLVAHAAQLAPSGGNAQPWKLVLTSERLKIFLDPTVTTKMDVKYRGSYVAIGAAIENARIAAAAKGILGPIEIFPSEKKDLVGVVNFGSSSDTELSDLYPLVMSRCTNRRPGQGKPLTPEISDQLRRNVESRGGRLHLLDSKDELEVYAELHGESDRLRFLAPLLHAEMMGELRWPGEDVMGRGLDVRTLELDDADLSKLAVARRADVMANLAAWNGGRALGEVTRARVKSSSALGVVTMPSSKPELYVKGGQALQRMWLSATDLGLAVQPVSLISVFAVSDDDFMALVPEAYVQRLKSLDAQFRRLSQLDSEEAVILVLRLSYAASPSARSLRLPLESVLLES